MANPTPPLKFREPQPANLKHWDPATRGNHEGYTAGYFLESAINHYLMTKKQDARLYNAAKKLADCWYNNLGPAPRSPGTTATSKWSRAGPLRPLRQRYGR